MVHGDMNRGVGATKTSGERKAHDFGSGASLSNAACRARIARIARNALPGGQHAYSLLEILVGLAVIGIVAAIAIPGYAKYAARAQIAQAVTDISVISVIIVKYVDQYNVPPDTLTQIGMQGRLDPWQQPYVYTNLVTAKGKGSARKDKNLNPLNSDFDLYSVGKDGQSKLPLSPKVSQDDVLRARDGRFIGLAKDFDP